MWFRLSLYFLVTSYTYFIFYSIAVASNFNIHLVLFFLRVFLQNENDEFMMNTFVFITFFFVIHLVSFAALIDLQIN